MIYEERPAPAGFEPFVTRLWYLEAPRIRPYEKILPLPYVHAIVNLSEPYRLFDRQGDSRLVERAFVSGIQSEYLVIESPPVIRHLGIEFSPAGLRAVTAVDPHRVTGRVQDASLVLPGLDGIEAPRGSAPAEALDAVAAHLSTLRREVEPDRLVERALQAIHRDSRARIGALAASAGVTHKTLISRFSAACGITPKAYSEVWRFHRFVMEIPHGGAPPSWAALAASSPYYDQPHVIRAFRRFSGYTPAEYLRRVAEFGADAASFVPLDEAPGG